MLSNPRRRAVVIGASMAGLTAARVLADHFESVTVLDRDQLPDGAEPRKGVPQGRHAHALLAGGARAMAELFPGLMEDMVSDGAALLDFNDGSWFQAGGHRASSLLERKVISASRPFLEGAVRRRVATLPNVRIQSGMAVEGLTHADNRILGVRVHDGTDTLMIDADLVVDCSGRSSQASRWLHEAGFARPEVVEVVCDMRYATMVVRCRPEHLDGTFAVTIETPPDGKRAAFLLPIEHDRWILTLAAGHGAPSATDEASLRKGIASLPSLEIHHALAAAEPLGPVATHRLMSSQRRRYEKLRHPPSGFLALGDAVCSFNPVYGQGMTCAVLQAVELGRCLERHGNDRRLVRAYFKGAAQVIANPWLIAVGGDFAYRECRGPKPFGVDMANRYLSRVLVAAQVSPEVNTAMILVQNLLAPPSILFKPSMLRAVRRAARHADVRSPADTPVTHQRAPQLA